MPNNTRNMNQNRDTFGSAGEAVLLSIIFLATLSLILINVVRKSGAWVIIMPFSWMFWEMARDSWREVLGKEEDTNVQPHNRRQGDVR